ncbi:hypothetical protein F5887DRAFT_936978, partial [Amanita rubescens]
ELEVVEDSEPEREALRSSLRVQGAWEVRDSLTRKTDDVGCAPLPSAALVSSIHAAKSTLLAASSLASPEEDASEEEKIIDLRGFAYSAAKPPESSRVLEPKTKPKKRIRANFFEDDLPSDHVAKLTKCVSCDAQWTTRKSASQKTKHIQSCARKKGFTSDTIRVALLKEVERMKANTENTLLENTVNAVAMGKKARHRAKKTVESIAVTRDIILDRAKQILASRMPSIGDDDEFPMPSTQPFGQSALEERCLSKTKLFTEASTESPSRSRTPFADTHVKNALTDHHDSNVGTAPDPFDMIPGDASRRKKGKATSKAAHYTDEGNELLEQRNVCGQINVDPLGMDEQWIHRLRSLILQDRDLHLSILHYEPVHFDVFEELASANGLVKVTKTSLRTFLDAEAIHYHGAEPSGSRQEKY